MQATSTDFDGVGDVDGRDFLLWQRGFGTPAPTAIKSKGDADNDLDVDGPDLSVWQLQYGSVPGPVVALVSDSEKESTVPSFFMAVDKGHNSHDSASVVEDRYIADVDRAIDEWGAPATSHVPSFGQMVARRGVRRLPR